MSLEKVAEQVALADTSHRTHCLTMPAPTARSSPSVERDRAIGPGLAKASAGATELALSLLGLTAAAAEPAPSSTPLAWAEGMGR